MSVTLIFEMQEASGALFLKAKVYFFGIITPLSTVIVPLTTMYASLKSYRSYLSINVLNLIGLLVLYLFSVSPN